MPHPSPPAPSLRRPLPTSETIPARDGERSKPPAIDSPESRGVEELLWQLLPIGTALLCAGMLATWAPHYLGWPWWPDLDTNAAMALGWSRGVLPYRDVTAFAFPGQIYLFRVLLATFGSGKTWPIYAADLGLLLGFSLLLVIWSRRNFGVSWPGLVGCASLIGYAAGLNFSLVAQRDWQATLLIGAALLASTTWPNRAGRTASAIATAAALTFRPHVLVFGPALVLAVSSSGRERSIRAVLSWGLMFLIGTGLAFSPLIVSGIFDDFLRGVRLASYDGAYNRATPAGMLAAVVRQATEARWLAVPVLVAMLGRSGSAPVRREARIWLVAALGVLLYKPLHPFPHDYLDHPRWVVWSVLLGLLSAIVLAGADLTARVRLAVAVAILAAAVPSRPEFCNPRASLEAIRLALSGSADSGRRSPPPGYVHHMTSYQALLPPWDDYRRMLDYLRQTVEPETPVANLLNYQLAVNGATGRLPVFPNESGLLWKSQVGWSERYFIDQLNHAPGAVVVWSPGLDGPEPDLVSPAIVEAVEAGFEPEATFGTLEVWRRKCPPVTPGESVPAPIAERAR